MKKLLSSVLAMTLILGVTGCAKKSNYNKISKKIIEAAESELDAEEASKKQKKSYLDDSGDPTSGDPIYASYTQDELEEFTMDGMLDEESLKNMTLVGASENEEKYMCILLEFIDKDDAEDFFEEISENNSDMYSAKEIKSLKKLGDVEYAVDDEDDDEYSYIMTLDVKDYEGESISTALHMKIDGNVVIYMGYFSRTTSDMLDEFIDFSKEAGLVDFEEMLEDA